MASRRHAWTPHNLGRPDEEITRRDVARQIRRYRGAAGVSAEWMATQLQIEPHEYEQMEAGTTSVSVEHLVSIAHLLGTEVNALLSDVPAPEVSRSIRKHLDLARKIQRLPKDSRLICLRAVSALGTLAREEERLRALKAGEGSGPHEDEG